RRFRARSCSAAAPERADCAACSARWSWMDRNPAWQLNGGGCVPYTIGAWNIEPSEDEGLDVLHGLRLVTGLVIIADEMKKAMHCEMREMMRKRFVLRMRLTFRRLIGDHDVAEQARSGAIDFPGIGRKGKNVGRHVL